MTQRTPDGRAPCAMCDSMRFLVGKDGQSLRPCPACMESIRLNETPKSDKPEREHWQTKEGRR